jgi:hypothetical protein
MTGGVVSDMVKARVLNRMWLDRKLGNRPQPKVIKNVRPYRSLTNCPVIYH